MFWPVVVAVTVTMLRTSGEDVAREKWSVALVRRTTVPSSVMPAAEVSSSSQTTRPAESVVRTPPLAFAVQFAVTIVSPPAPIQRPPSVVVVAVEEAVILPLIVSAPPTVEEARERKPESKEASEATESEEEALREPATLSELSIVEEAEETKPAILPRASIEKSVVEALSESVMRKGVPP